MSSSVFMFALIPKSYVSGLNKRSQRRRMNGLLCIVSGCQPVSLPREHYDLEDEPY
jgi:hypothetical protein